MKKWFIGVCFVVALVSLVNTVYLYGIVSRNTEVLSNFVDSMSSSNDIENLDVGTSDIGYSLANVKYLKGAFKGVADLGNVDLQATYSRDTKQLEVSVVCPESFDGYLVYVCVGAFGDDCRKDLVTDYTIRGSREYSNTIDVTEDGISSLKVVVGYINRNEEFLVENGVNWGVESVSVSLK